MRPRNCGLLVILALAFVVSVPASAGQVVWNGALVDAGAIPDVAPVGSVVNAPGNSPDPNWGTSNYITYHVTACDATLRGGAWGDHNCSYVESTSASAVSVGYSLHIPSGAKVSYVRIYFNQTGASETISAGFYRFTELTQGHYGEFSLITTVSPGGTTAGDTVTDFGPLTEVIDNAPATGYTYQILAVTHGGTKIYKFTVYYNLQVSPAPGSATFTDVPTNYWAFQYIEALAASGITAGCGGGNFCPETTITRAQMAVFLSKALGLSYLY
jgi:hypothetical protein